MDSSTILIIGFVVLVIGASIIYAQISKRRRRDAYKQLADKLMFSHSESNETLKDRMSSFYLGSRGRGHKILNALTGAQDSISMTLFDHYFKTGYGRSTRHYNNTVLEITSSRLNLPSFTLRQKGFFDGLSKAFGKEQRVDVNGSDAFTKTYVVAARDPGSEMLIQELFDSGRQSFFVSNDDYNVEGQGDRLLVYGKDKQIKAGDIDAFIRDAQTVFEQFASSSDWS